MPGYDKTGPLGDGPMSGWGRGTCGSNQSGRTPMGRGFGGNFGFRRGMRGGFGRRVGMRALGSETEGEQGDLKSQIDDLRRSLTAIEQQLNRISQSDR
ncbi:MAG: DUF5320 domain-containing protein [Desulfofustis sp.]|jgi:hypothetical protein|nr:DUF5320 domain-containing protein [Desulfofustis sp.]